MIKICYSAVPQAYLDFIRKFKGKMEKWLRKGVIGNQGTQVALTDEGRLIFRYLNKGDNLKKYLLTDAKKYRDLIYYVEKRFPDLKKLREGDKTANKSLYQCLSKAFDAFGYGDADFPRFALCKALGLKACPYCNAEDLTTMELEDIDKELRDSELDHFYPRKLFPYLAISLYNLIPSGTLCNGGNCKHEKDTYKEGLTNLFELNGSEGIEFAMDIKGKGILSYDTFERSVEIETKVVDDALKDNCRIFLLKSRYRKEKSQTLRIWMMHKECESEGYRKMVERKGRALGTTLDFEKWFAAETGINTKNYNDHKLSKMSMDIWRQLEEIRKVYV